MNTSTKALASEAALFEKLRLQGMNVKPKNAWMKSFGRAREDQAFESAMRLGAEWRDEENRRSLDDLNHRNAHS